MKRILWVLSLLLLALERRNLVTAGESQCQCHFSSEDRDSTDCVTYGQLGDGVLIAWSIASQECLDRFQIKDEAIDPSMLSSMFPNTNGSSGSISHLVNYLRFDGGSVASSITAGFPQFYEESKTQPGKMELREEITVNGVTTACTSQGGGSASQCYNVMKLYFETEPGASEMAGVGHQLYQAAALSREKEQSMVRIRLCSDGAAPECGILSDQVQQIMAENADNDELFCSAYGLGPASLDYPKCGGSRSGDGHNSNSGSSGTSTDWSSSSARSISQQRAAAAFFAFVVSVVL